MPLPHTCDKKLFYSAQYQAYQRWRWQFRNAVNILPICVCSWSVVHNDMELGIYCDCRHSMPNRKIDPWSIFVAILWSIAIEMRASSYSSLSRYFRGSNFPFPHWLASSPTRPYNTLATGLPCECVKS